MGLLFDLIFLMRFTIIYNIQAAHSTFLSNKQSNRYVVKLDYFLRESFEHYTLCRTGRKFWRMPPKKKGDEKKQVMHLKSPRYVQTKAKKASSFQKKT